MPGTTMRNASDAGDSNSRRDRVGLPGRLLADALGKPAIHAALGRRFFGDGLMLLLALPIYLVGIGWGWGAESLWSWDEVRPAAVLAPPYGDGPSWPPKYPLLHRDLLQGVFLVVKPVIRQVVGDEPLAVEHGLFLAARGVTLLLALATLWLAVDTSRRLGSWRSGLLAGGAWLATLPQAYYAKTTNLDAPYLFWFALASWAMARFELEGSRRKMQLFVVAAAAAILTKDQAYGLFVLPVAVLIARLVRPGGRGFSRREGFAAFAVAAGGSLVLALASYRLWGGVDLLRRHLEAVAAAPERYRFTASDLDGPGRVVLLAFRHVVWSFGAPLSVAVFVGAVAALARLRRGDSQARGAALLLLFPLSYALFTLAPLGYHYDRFFLPVCWTLSILGSVGFDRRWGPLNQPLAARLLQPAVAAAFAFGIAIGISRVFALDAAMAGDRRIELEEATRGRARVAVYAHEVRPPQGFVRQRVVPRAAPAPAPAALAGFEVVAIPAADLGSIGMSRLAGRLAAGECGFRPTRPELALPSPFHRRVDFSRVLSNLGEIDPRILVFEREGPRRVCEAEPTPP